MNIVKTCKKCGLEFPATTEYFYKDNACKYGVKAVCIVCRDKQRKDWYLANKDRCISKVRRYQEENKDALKLKSKLYRERTREKIREKKREYKKANPEKANLDKKHTKQRRRAIRNQLPHNYATAEWLLCVGHFQHQCAYCGANTTLTQDHFVPISKGGEYTKNNIIPACHMCNSRKNNKDFFEWYPAQKFYNVKREQAILKYLNYDKQLKNQQLQIIG